MKLFETPGRWILPGAFVLSALMSVQCIGLPEFRDYPLLRRLSMLLGTLPRSHASGVSTGGVLLGPAGGAFETPDEILRVEVPPGALSETVRFSVRRYPVQAGEIPAPYWPASEAYEITPSYRFDKDIRVYIRVDPDQPRTEVSGLIATDMHESRHALSLGDWQEAEARREGDRVVMRTRTFSFFVAGRRSRADLLRPTISRATLELRTDGSDLPHRVRARIKHPGGEEFTAALLVGPVGGTPREFPMRRRDDSDWFEAPVPPEMLGARGVALRVLVRDASGAERRLPQASFFEFPGRTYDEGLIRRYRAFRSKPR